MAQKAGSTEEGFALNSVKLGPPVIEPGKIICGFKLYRPCSDGNPIPEEPVLFGSTQCHCWPWMGNLFATESKQVDFEAELAVVIGEKLTGLVKKKPLAAWQAT